MTCQGWESLKRKLWLQIVFFLHNCPHCRVCGAWSLPCVCRVCGECGFNRCQRTANCQLPTTNRKIKITYWDRAGGIVRNA